MPQYLSIKWKGNRIMARKKGKKMGRPAGSKNGEKKAPRLTPRIDTEMPEGFVMPAGAQVPNWDYEKQKVLRGVIVQIKTITKKKPRKGEKPKTRLMVIRENDTEKLYQVWESAGNVGLFDEAKQGAEVFIRYDGLGAKVKGKNQMRLFTTGYASKSRR
jgi:hypothetical protein